MSNVSPAAVIKKKKKNQPAPSDLVTAVGELFDIAVNGAPPLKLQSMARDKLFEMLVLARVLRVFRLAHPNGRVEHFPPSKGGALADVVVAAKPALADRSRFSHFDLFDDAGDLVAEAWTSVEFESLSWEISGGAPGRAHRQARHELDVCILEPQAGKQPTHSQVHAGISCKDVRSASKENVREALGLRRETAYLSAMQKSLVSWLVPQINAKPASAILLASSHVGVRRYAKPINSMGVYARYVRRPWASE